MAPPGGKRLARTPGEGQKQSNVSPYQRPIRPTAISYMHSGDSGGPSPRHRSAAISMGMEASILEGSATSDEYYEASQSRQILSLPESLSAHRNSIDHVAALNERGLEGFEKGPQGDMTCGRIGLKTWTTLQCLLEHIIARSSCLHVICVTSSSFCRLVPRKGAGPDLRNEGGGKIDEYLMRLLRTGLMPAGAPSKQKVCFVAWQGQT